jgi:HSP20 family molecular chaperone IbpA
MTAYLDLINKFNKDVWNHSDRVFGDTFDSIFDSWSKAQSFPFYNVVKYGKGEYAIELDASMEDGVLTIKLGVNEPEEIKPIDITIK